MLLFVAAGAHHYWGQSFDQRGGGGGCSRQICLYERLRPEVQPRIYPFRIPSSDKCYPFHIPYLELCIPFNRCKYTIFYLGINYKHKTFS